MARNNEMSLGDAIKRFLDTYELRQGFNEAQIELTWAKIMGEVIDKYTGEIYIRNKKLFVRINSAVVRQELTYARTKIREKINEELGGNYIEEVVLL